MAAARGGGGAEDPGAGGRAADRGQQPAAARGQRGEGARQGGDLPEADRRPHPQVLTRRVSDV